MAREHRIRFKGTSKRQSGLIAGKTYLKFCCFTVELIFFNEPFGQTFPHSPRKRHQWKWLKLFVN
jgi:hypothetical protein